MIVVGILGDIGSGKSFVSKLFKCPVFNADIEVNKIYRKNNNCYRKFLHTHTSKGRTSHTHTCTK